MSNVSDVPFASAVQELREALGVRLTGYISGANKASTVTAWADGELEPEPAVIERITAAHMVVTLLSERYGSITIRTWLMGMNPFLGNEAPAEYLRHIGLADGTGIALKPRTNAHEVWIAAAEFRYE